jgi:hypothetical protein
MPGVPVRHYDKLPPLSWVYFPGIIFDFWATLITSAYLTGLLVYRLSGDAEGVRKMRGDEGYQRVTRLFGLISLGWLIASFLIDLRFPYIFRPSHILCVTLLMVLGYDAWDWWNRKSKTEDGDPVAG